MGYDLRAFASAAHDILAGAPGPEGRQRVCDLMRDALRDPGFVASVLGDATPERQILYEDPELGFCILAHNYQGAKQSPPHDHGPSWAIYGQARGRDADDAIGRWSSPRPRTGPARCATYVTTRSRRAWRTSTTRATCTLPVATARPS